MRAQEIATFEKRKNGVQGYVAVIEGVKQFYQVDKNDPESFKDKTDALQAIQDDLDEAAKTKKASAAKSKTVKAEVAAPVASKGKTAPKAETAPVASGKKGVKAEVAAPVASKGKTAPKAETAPVAPVKGKGSKAETAAPAPASQKTAIAKAVVAVKAEEVAKWKDNGKGEVGYEAAIAGKKVFYQVDKADPDCFKTKQAALKAVQEDLDSAAAKKTTKPAAATVAAPAAKAARQAPASKDKPKAVTGNTCISFSPVVGVMRQQRERDGYAYWSSIFKDENGQRVQKCFAVKKYGEEDAFLEAVRFNFQAKGEVVLKQDFTDKLPLDQKVLAKKLGATKGQIHIQ